MLSEYPDILTTDEACEAAITPCTISYSPASSKPTETADCGAFRRNPSSNTSWNSPN